MSKKREKDVTVVETESSGKVNIVAQELKFAKLLACNDPKIRNGVLKSLKKWLNTRSQSSYQFTNKDFLRLWKGLYYCMWMSDKPLVQEELSEELGSLLHCFPDVKISIQFFQNFLETMCLEWFGIDQWRIDKFMMLVRRVFRQMLFAIKNAEWEDEAVKLFTHALEKTVFHTTKCPKGLILHVCDFYIEEIAKVADGELSEDRTHALIEPFMIYYTKLSDHIILRHVEKTIFEQLLYQSELGQEYQETFDIWKKADFPTKSIEDIEINYQVRGNKSFTDDDLSDGEENDMDEERALDPRAGRVNVNLTEIKFDALKLAETIENLRYKPFASSKSRKGLARMAQQLRKFADDIFPLGIHKIPYSSEDNEDPIDVDLKAIQLAEFQKKLAIGDVDSESSDFDEDLDNRKHGKLKRKNKEEKACKTKEKKQKLSKLHNERFFEATEDFTKDQPVPEDEEEDTIPKDTIAEVKVKKKKKNNKDDETPRVKIKKRKPVDAKKSIKVIEEPAETSPSTEQPTDATFKITDEWSEPPKEGEVEFFVPSRKTKLKALQQAEETETRDAQSSVSSAKKIKIDEQLVTPPRINLLSDIATTNSGKRVKIALNKNQAQSAHEYIKQVKQSPNLPTNNLLKKPIKGVLKPSALPSPINPFYQKKLSKNFNKSF